MKRLIRHGEPTELTAYRAQNPAVSWEQMRGDASGRAVYERIRPQLIDGQGGLCAYCEIDIHDNDPLKCRVEHFHPKSDTSTAHNWALDWQNMMAVCMGGTQVHQSPPHALEPIRENLSCDAHKEQMITSGKLDAHCQGWIIDPLNLPAFPCLFFLEKSTGKLLPDADLCTRIELPGNKHRDTEALVQHTIDILNLNCDRLRQARLVLVRDIERKKKKQRDQGFSAQQGLGNLATFYLRRHWPGFFTTIRLCLGTAAEQYLTQIQFQG